MKCTECEMPVPVNGPTQRVKCGHCQNAIALKGRLRWEEVLNFKNPNITVFAFAARAKSGAEERGAWAPVSLTAVPRWPQCECKAPYGGSGRAAAEAIESGVRALACTKCNKSVAVAPVPAFFKKSFPYATHTVGAAIAAEALRGTSGAIEVKCRSCGANLPLDGETRLVECKFCQASATLGDDVWLALHPVKTKELWWVIFDPTPLVAK